MTGFVFSEAVYELVLFGFAPLFLTVATVWILWHVLETIHPDEVIHIQFFLTFILVAVPFVMLIYFGLATVLYDKMIAVSGGSQSALLPLEPMSGATVAGAVIYIGLTVWLWSHWRKLRMRQRGTLQHLAR
jgi:hypothetical protein